MSGRVYLHLFPLLLSSILISAESEKHLCHQKALVPTPPSLTIVGRKVIPLSHMLYTTVVLHTIMYTLLTQHQQQQQWHTLKYKKYIAKKM